MKPLFFIGLAVCIHIASYSQTTAIVIQNKLQISVNPQEGPVKISKTDLSKVEVITTDHGKLDGYTIGFKMDDTNYYSKKSEIDSLNTNVRIKLMGIPAGSHFYLYDVQMKTTDKIGLSQKRYEFVLTD